MASEKLEPVEVAKGRLEDVETRLTVWAKTVDADSITIHSLRDNDFAFSAEEIEELIDSAQKEGFSIILEVGEDAVDTITLTKGAYDFISPEPRKPIEPGETIELKTAESLIPAGTFPGQSESRKKTFVGEISRKIELGDLARALGSGARLRIKLDES